MTNREEIERRRTFAIISHPDAGKTTLTEKLLLYGGAINQAGSVKGKQSAKHAVSDWMDIEKQRGISVTSSVLQFNYAGKCVNILDTPGHQDFSEDTYRTLMAADSAVMVIDAAKGVEAQTIKLFKVCTLRHIPIFTFINKMDREARDPFELCEELEKELRAKWKEEREATSTADMAAANNTDAWSSAGAVKEEENTVSEDAESVALLVCSNQMIEWKSPSSLCTRFSRSLRVVGTCPLWDPRSVSADL